jgi:hypothetical protein
MQIENLKELIVLSLETIGFALVCIILIYYFGKQADALRGMHEAVHDIHITWMKDRRKELKREVHVPDATQWVRQQVGVDAPLGVKCLFAEPPLVDFNVDDGGLRLVVSPLKYRQIRTALKIQNRKNGGVMKQFLNPVMGRFPWSATTIERNLTNGGEWFDVEAGQVGRQLGLDWGEVDRLYFHLIKG